MNKCLVTKLKAHTNNEALSKYNVLTIKTKVIDSPTTSSQYLSIGTSENSGVSINSSNVDLLQSLPNGDRYSYPLNIPANATWAFYFDNKDGIIEVTSKYNISKLIVGDCGAVRMKEIYGIPGTINHLNLSNIEEEEIDATKLRNALDLGKFTGLYLPEKDVFNKLSKNTIGEFKAINEITRPICSLFDSVGLDDITNNVSVTIIDFYQLNPGNLSSLAKLINLTAIVFMDSKQNSGDIMDFINPWIQAGRTSGKFNVVNLLGQKNITLNGQPITYPSGVTNANAYLNWTSEGTVTFTAS